MQIKQIIYYLVFSQSDIVNRNSRIYTADEYVPHVEKMMEKKSWGVIYGEYDHPDVFDVSMKCVSHTVENAFFNKEKNRVDGDIRLLNTHYGKDAKALLDDGLPLFVSSRAAGITESNGVVKLKQLFTYDIVADPGFASAKMQVKNINESLNYGDNSLMVVESTKQQLSLLSNKYDESANYKIFDLTNETKTNELFNMNKNDLVTKKQLSEWSNYLTKEIKSTNATLLAKITESKGSSKTDSKSEIEKLIEYNENLKAQNEKIIGYLDYVADKLQFCINTSEVLEKKTDKIVEYSNYLSENLDKAIDYSNYLAEQLDNSIDYSNYLAEGLGKAIDYTNYLAENLDKAIDYSEYISENLTNSIKYSNYLAENLDKAIDYSDYIAENLDVNIGYSSYLAESLDVNIGYVQYIGENLDSTINYADYISECVDKVLDYSNKISESINNSNGLISEKIISADEYLLTESKTHKKVKEEEKEMDMDKKSKKVKDKKFKKAEKSEEEEETIVTSLTESVIAEKVEKSEIIKNIYTNTNESLNNRIDSLIEEAKKREASKVVKPNFYEFLTAEDIKTFESFSDDEQETIKVAINESTGYYSRHDVLSLVKQVLEKNKPTAEELLIEGMPAEIKPIWEKVDSKMKQSIISQSKFYDISTNQLVEHFWTTRNFDFVKTENKILLESNNPFENQHKLSNDEIEFFTNRFKRIK